MVTIICPTYNEEKYISRCIDSMIQQDFPHEVELLFVDGGSSDKTRDIISTYREKYSFIKTFDNPCRIVSYAMNIGIENAKGNVIIRIDAHSYFPPDYVSTLYKAIRELDADNVGVVSKTDVLNKTPKTLAIREVLSNRFGVGNSLFRTGVDEITEVDTVPFGCYRKEIFEKHGMFDVRLTRNQDIEFNKRIIREGGRILLLPDTQCTYYARETFTAMMNNNYDNGKWNVLTVYYTNRFDSISLRHFVPMFFVLSLIMPPLLALIYPPIISLTIVSLTLYVVFLLLVSVKEVISKKLNVLLLMAAFSLLHISYGIGSIAGLIKLPFLKVKNEDHVPKECI